MKRRIMVFLSILVFTILSTPALWAAAEEELPQKPHSTLVDLIYTFLPIVVIAGLFFWFIRRVQRSPRSLQLYDATERHYQRQEQHLEQQEKHLLRQEQLLERIAIALEKNNKPQ